MQEAHAAHAEGVYRKTIQVMQDEVCLLLSRAFFFALLTLSSSTLSPCALPPVYRSVLRHFSHPAYPPQPPQSLPLRVYSKDFTHARHRCRHSLAIACSAAGSYGTWASGSTWRRRLATCSHCATWLCLTTHSVPFLRNLICSVVASSLLAYKPKENPPALMCMSFLTDSAVMGCFRKRRQSTSPMPFRQFYIQTLSAANHRPWPHQRPGLFTQLPLLPTTPAGHPCPPIHWHIFSEP